MLSILSHLFSARAIFKSLFVIGLVHSNPAFAGVFENSQVSGGVDARVNWEEYEKPKSELYGAFLNYRKVFSDDLGDRWILSLQGDAEHDLKEIRSYQSFLQYKGPLGKWNVRAGHFILPFGMLNDLDTERLLLQSKEDETIGIKLDTGVSVFGFVEDLNWAISLTGGLGRRSINQYKNSYLTTVRVSKKMDDFTLGGSLLLGEIKADEDFPFEEEKIPQQKVALDGLYEFDQWITRFELLFGQEKAKFMGSAQVILDYQISNVWQLNLIGSSIFRNDSEQELGMGIGLKPLPGWVFRAADIYHFNHERNINEFRMQAAYEFSHGL